MNNILINMPETKKLYAFGKKQRINLALSENPLGCSPLVTSFMKKGGMNVSEYPDVTLSVLKGAIANMMGVNTDAVFISSGSEAIIGAVTKIVQKGEVIIPSLTFPMFEIVSQLANMKVVISPVNESLEIQLDDIETKITKNTKIIFLCNPNNPTGKLLRKEAIIELLQRCNCLVVVDEANIEFGGESIIDEVNNFDNLVVLRTFSKGFGLAGLRVGFCAANKTVVRLLEKVSQPFPITTFTAKLAEIALMDEKFIEFTKSFMIQEREFLTRELEKRGFIVVASEANNLFIDVSPFARNSTEFVAKLAAECVSVVDGASFGMNTFIRVSPRLRETNVAFLEAVDTINK